MRDPHEADVHWGLVNGRLAFRWEYTDHFGFWWAAHMYRVFPPTPERMVVWTSVTLLSESYDP